MENRDKIYIKNLLFKFNLFNTYELNNNDFENLENMKSIFQWSGQFPSYLISYLFDKYCDKDDVVLDPFSGSGTVLYEAIRRNIGCCAIDINPMAVELSKTYVFSKFDNKERKRYIDLSEMLLQNMIKKFDSPFEIDKKITDNDFGIIKKTLSEIKDPLILNILLNVLMRFSIITEKNTINGLYISFNLNKKIIENLPHVDKYIEVLTSDSKTLPIKNNVIDIIITSPPYPGIFDYYKNYKKIQYLLGKNISKTRKKEIGQNTKGSVSQNVLNYAKDMNKVFLEMRRVLKNKGRLILIINKNIKIKNKFLNFSYLLYVIAVELSGFRLIEKQQRIFINRSGNKTFEEILHFVPSEYIKNNPGVFLNNVVSYILEEK